jgi:hypothetical protein
MEFPVENSDPASLGRNYLQLTFLLGRFVYSAGDLRYLR